MADPQWPGLSKRRRSLRGGVVWSLIRLVVLSAAVLFADSVVTTRALQGSWRMEMPENVDEHVHALLFASQKRQSQQSAGIFGGALRDSLSRGVSKIGGALMTATAENVRYRIEDQSFTLQASQAEAQTLTAMMSAMARPGTDPITCSRGEIQAAFPFLHLTCFTDGADESIFFLMKGWPGESMSLFPLPVGEGELKDRAKQLQVQMGQGKPEDAPDPEVVEAMRELFTLRFVKVL